MLLFGASFLLVALWDVSNQTFGSSRTGGLTRFVSVWLFDTFGHWGPRVALIAGGVLFVAASLWFASLTKEDEASSNRGTRRSAVLSWTLVLLVLSLLAFIAVGPHLRNPAIDSVLSYWSERYYAPATFAMFVFVLGFWLRLDWKEFLETGDPWKLLSLPVLYLVLAIFFLIFFLLSSWKSIIGSA